MTSALPFRLRRILSQTVPDREQSGCVEPRTNWHVVVQATENDDGSRPDELLFAVEAFDQQRGKVIS